MNETINIIISIITLISIFISIFTLIKTLFLNKNEYMTLKEKDTMINQNIKIINKNSHDINILSKNFDDYKLLLYWDSYYLYKSIKEIYPKNDFCVIIKEYYNKELKTIIKTGDNLFVDDNQQIIEDNTDLNSIINDGYSYYFVTDLSTFSFVNKKYKNDEAGWVYKYNTSIIFPIKKQNEDSEIIGLICIYAKQSLTKKKNNDKIIKLLEKTNKSFSVTLQNLHTKTI